MCVGLESELFSHRLFLRRICSPSCYSREQVHFPSHDGPK